MMAGSHKPYLEAINSAWFNPFNPQIRCTIVCQINILVGVQTLVWQMTISQSDIYGVRVT
jgi:hypothetical protein